MRKFITSGVLALGFLGFQAGSAKAAEVIVKVPFAFEAGRKSFPAGEYVVDRLDRDPYVLVIRSTKLHSRAMAIIPVDPAPGHDPAGDKPSLTFMHRENQYRLSSIWEGRDQGQEVWGS